MKIQFKLTGLNCEACVKLCKIKLGKIKGVSEISINLNNGESYILANQKVTQDDLNTALRGTDYKAIINN